jgi:hypothetical protein
MIQYVTNKQFRLQKLDCDVSIKRHCVLFSLRYRGGGGHRMRTNVNSVQCSHMTLSSRATTT